MPWNISKKRADNDLSETCGQSLQGYRKGDTQQDNLLFIEGVPPNSASQAGLNSFLSDG